MTVAGAAISRGAGRVSRRLDRLSERRFALLVSIPGLILVALIVLPPTLAVFGMSLFRIELGKDDLVPFIGLRNYLVRLPADSEVLAAIPRTLIFAALSTADHPAAGARHRARPQPRLPRRVDLLHGAAAAVGGRLDRGRHLLALDLRHQPRDRERHPRRLRHPRRAVQLAGEHGPDDRHRPRRPVMAVRAAPRGPAAGRPQDDPAGPLPGGQDGRRDLLGELPVHHPAGDQEHPDRRRRPAGHHRAPGLRPAVQPHQRRPGTGHLCPDHGDLRHHVRPDQPGLRRRDHGHPVPDHRRGQLPDPDRAGPPARRRSPSSTTRPRMPRPPVAPRCGSIRRRRIAHAASPRRPRTRRRSRIRLPRIGHQGRLRRRRARALLLLRRAHRLDDHRQPAADPGPRHACPRT